MKEILIEEKKQLIDKIIDSRFHQSESSRLIEYVTGIPLGEADNILERMSTKNPQLENQLKRDREEVRSKIGNVFSLDYEDPQEYKEYLLNLGEEDKKTFDTFFGDELDWSMVDESNPSSYKLGIKWLEIQYIFVFLHKLDPDLSFERKIYEACLFRREELENFYDLRDFCFTSHFIIKNYYNNLGVTPEWATPFYFLKNKDGISQEAIDRYVQEKTKDEIEPTKDSS